MCKHHFSVRGHQPKEKWQAISVYIRANPFGAEVRRLYLRLAKAVKGDKVRCTPISHGEGKKSMYDHDDAKIERKNDSGYLYK